MYKDLISYQLADGITEEHLLKVAQEIIDTWMKKLPGFQSWEIGCDADGNYTDIVFWDNEASAKEAEKAMEKIPNAMDWFSCYKPESIKGAQLFIKGKF